MSEFPQLDPWMIDALPLGRVTLYIALAEERVKHRAREQKRLEAEARAAGRR